MNSNSNGRLALYGATALVAAMIGGGITAAASIAAAEAPAVPPIPAIPAMPASMQAGPAIRAVPVPPSAPLPPAAPDRLATLDIPEPPAPPSVSKVVISRHGKLSAEEREAIREAREAAREANQEAAEARREAMQAAAEARQEAAEARREAVEARLHARPGELAGAAQARQRAVRQAEVARRQAFAERDRILRDVPRMVAAHLAATRSRMVADCARRGVTMSATADFGALALCGDATSRTVRVALENARASIAAAPDIGEAQRRGALKGIDDALVELRREQ